MNDVLSTSAKTKVDSETHFFAPGPDPMTARLHDRLVEYGYKLPEDPLPESGVFYSKTLYHISGGAKLAELADDALGAIF